MKAYHQSILYRRMKSFLIILALILIAIFLIMKIYQIGNIIVKDKSKSQMFTEGNYGDPLGRQSNVLGNSSSALENCSFENYVFGQHSHQTDPCLIATFKMKLLLPPTPFQERNTYSLNINKEMPSNIEKFKLVEKILIENAGPYGLRKKPGFFIECGANDGEFISPTIRLERQYNWTGLLIEPNPIPFRNLLKKKRNAWSVNAAACITDHPEQLTFYTNPMETGISSLKANPWRGVSVNITVQCIPLYTMLAALNIRTVDYLSLDVEGLELSILKTLPFDKVAFKILTVEFIHVPGRQTAINEFLEPLGYKFVKIIWDSLTLDCLYVHESLYERAISIRI